ncbi:hypothetical protein LQV63_04000 [Paenibacillus profundus]|uniref:Uncharacterized protein n=1 Tax=Paenibacillus profundus TaxID=1173085 RepID=A0ABS8Y9E7_9BACL|nr:hypothetical protein [Paenibacillus profundus]MCE5168476.1 hypothetical protein [Paenibacillus profundus]
MKKIMGLCLAMVLILSFSSSAFASAILIDNLTHRSTSDFKDSFTLNEKNGKTLNVHVKNRHSTDPVYLTVTGSSEKKIRAEEEITVPVEVKGKEKKINIKVTNKTGHRMDLFIHARQF